MWRLKGDTSLGASERGLRRVRFGKPRSNKTSRKKKKEGEGSVLLKSQKERRNTEKKNHGVSTGGG